MRLLPVKRLIQGGVLTGIICGLGALGVYILIAPWPYLPHIGLRHPAPGPAALTRPTRDAFTVDQPSPGPGRRVPTATANAPTPSPTGTRGDGRPALVTSTPSRTPAPTPYAPTPAPRQTIRVPSVSPVVSPQPTATCLLARNLLGMPICL